MCTLVSILLKGLNITLVTLAYFNFFKISKDFLDARYRKVKSHACLKLIYNNEKEEGIFGGKFSICG